MNKEYIKDNYKKLYFKYKSKYLKLKQSHYSILNKYDMTGGNNIIIDIENIISMDGENGNDNLTNKISNYLIDNDIPINIQSNEYNIVELKNQLQNIDKLYDIRTKIYSMDESNTNEILDYIIDQYKITSISSHIEQLFTSNILGYNKNYIIFYMVLLRWLIVNKIQLSIKDNYISYLSLYSLTSCLDTRLNSDEYLPMILILIIEYINLFPIKKVLLIKTPKEIVKNSIESNNNTRQKLIKFDTKNKFLQYDSGNIKEANKLNFDDLILILHNLFMIVKY
jgi:hypothetical protein